jgi:anti-anti-sigma factor
MTTQSSLRIGEGRADDVVVLTLAGEISLDEGDLVLSKHVDTLIKQSHVKLVLDLSGITYIDSAGMAMMVAQLKEVRRHGGAMKLAALTAKTQQLFAMLKLKFVFEIFDTVEQAVESFKQGVR